MTPQYTNNANMNPFNSENSGNTKEYSLIKNIIGNVYGGHSIPIGNFDIKRIFLK
jgi:hypothetical protein